MRKDAARKCPPPIGKKWSSERDVDARFLQKMAHDGCMRTLRNTSMSVGEDLHFQSLKRCQGMAGRPCTMAYTLRYQPLYYGDNCFRHGLHINDSALAPRNTAFTSASEI